MSRIRERARRRLLLMTSGNRIEQFFRELRWDADGNDLAQIEQLQEQAKRIMAGVPEDSVASTGAMRIDPNALYPRRALLAMGMSKRLVNSLASSRVQRGQYLGSAVIAVLEGRTRAAKHPVQFNARRQYNGR